MIYGYVRVSSTTQNVDRQTEEMKRFDIPEQSGSLQDCDKGFAFVTPRVIMPYSCRFRPAQEVHHHQLNGLGTHVELLFVSGFGGWLQCISNRVFLLLMKASMKYPTVLRSLLL